MSLDKFTLLLMKNDMRQLLGTGDLTNTPRYTHTWRNKRNIMYTDVSRSDGSLERRYRMQLGFGKWWCII